MTSVGISTKTSRTLLSFTSSKIIPFSSLAEESGITLYPQSLRAFTKGLFLSKMILLINLWAFGGCHPADAPVRRDLVPAG